MGRKTYKYMYVKIMNTRWALRTQKLGSRYLETGDGAGGKLEFKKGGEGIEKTDLGE